MTQQQTKGQSASNAPAVTLNFGDLSTFHVAGGNANTKRSTSKLEAPFTVLPATAAAARLFAGLVITRKPATLPDGTPIRLPGGKVAPRDLLLWRDQLWNDLALVLPANEQAAMLAVITPGSPKLIRTIADASTRPDASDGNAGQHQETTTGYFMRSIGLAILRAERQGVKANPDGSFTLPAGFLMERPETNGRKETRGMPTAEARRYQSEHQTQL